jgi:hypothetical protein
VAQIPEAGGISRDAFADHIIARSDGAIGSKSDTTLANAKAETIACSEVVMVASCAGNIAVSGKDFVVKQKLPNLCLQWVEGQEIIR